ncbi:MAG: glycine cleavage system aminomethyltransferase GcvT [Litorilinea sp.]
MQQTALYASHVELGGRMVDFAGWELPVQYPTGPLAEHQAVRTAAGIFDIDHMGQFVVRGPDAESYLQYIQPRDISTMQVDDAAYSLLLYADGTIIDDIFIYRRPDHWMVVVNAANRAKDLTWVTTHATDFEVSVEDISDQTYMLAIQGPRAAAILQKIVTPDLMNVAARTALATTLQDAPMLLGRTGYTGEDGFEIYLPTENAPALWHALLDAGADEGLLPCGLAARDSLRFEACMPLYGHEISADITPLAARLGWLIAWEKEFVGRNALLKHKLEGPTRLLVGFEMIDRAVPREHYAITIEDAPAGQDAGFVTTGMKSPTLDRFLGMGYVPPSHSKPGAEFHIVVRNQPKLARVVRRPFYKPRYKE